MQQWKPSREAIRLSGWVLLCTLMANVEFSVLTLQANYKSMLQLPEPDLASEMVDLLSCQKSEVIRVGNYAGARSGAAGKALLRDIRTTVRL